MAYEFAKLRGRMVEKKFDARALACQIGMAESSLSLRLCGKRQFRLKEIEQIVDVLDIPEDQIASYFFTSKVA